jgi:hypothetical protein
VPEESFTTDVSVSFCADDRSVQKQARKKRRGFINKDVPV